MPKTVKKPAAPAKKVTAPVIAPKAMKKAAAAPAAKPMLKSAKKAEPKIKLEVTSSKKGDKKSAKLELKAIEVVVQVTEEEEEEMESASSSGGASQGNLAMAAATAETAAGSLKNFRHHPDIENFYRFIYENDLRYEALEIIDRMAAQGLVLKSTRAARARPN
jgi:hypothetical protein